MEASRLTPTGLLPFAPTNNTNAIRNERGEDHPFVLGWKWGEKSRLP